jgi:hypothetical protein
MPRGKNEPREKGRRQREGGTQRAQGGTIRQFCSAFLFERGYLFSASFNDTGHTRSISAIRIDLAETRRKMLRWS